MIYIIRGALLTGILVFTALFVVCFYENRNGAACALVFAIQAFSGLLFWSVSPEFERWLNEETGVKGPTS